MSTRLKFLVAALLVLGGILILPRLTRKQGRSESERIARELTAQKNKTDNLRNAMRYLQQMTPMNRGQTNKEVRLELNTWIQHADAQALDYSPPELFDSLPAEMVDYVGCRSPITLEFSEADIGYLFERRLMSRLAEWVAEFPIRDSLMSEIIQKKTATLSEADALKLEDAYKLFDWSMRNVALDPKSSSVEERTVLSTGQVVNDGLGYGYTAWESLLFSSGDFVERGRVFTALAHQRGIDTAWIAAGDAIWAIGVVLSDEILIFEPKLAMPVLEPDRVELASLQQALENSRVLRRLDLPGQFDYAFSSADLKSLRFLIDLPPTAGSARMKLLESALLRDERMVLYHDVEQMAERFRGLVPQDAQVAAFEIPLLAQIHAAMVQEQLQDTTSYTVEYMAKHGIWMLDNPAANGRMNHLQGRFENTLDERGALSLYMECRTDDESIREMAYDPDVQKRMGLQRRQGQDLESFQGEIMQAQYIFSKAKVDASFLLAQLHFDRGDFQQAANWFEKRVINNDSPMAEPWKPISRYGLARAQAELGDMEAAAEQLSYTPSPQEAGNRLRLRYLRKVFGDEADVNAEDAETDS